MVVLTYLADDVVDAVRGLAVGADNFGADDRQRAHFALCLLQELLVAI